MKCGCKEKLTPAPFCPTKKSLIDYVKEWVEKVKVWAAGIEQEIAILEEAAGFDPQSLVDELAAKADKVESATNGNFASLDSEGNLKDSGKKSSDFATAAQGAKADTALQSADIENKLDKVSSVTADHFTALNADGTLKDSGYSDSSFALRSHIHGEISNTDQTDGMAEVQTEVSEPYGGEIRLYVKKGSDGTLKNATITDDNIANLNRALETPDSSPTLDSTKLITSGGVYASINSTYEFLLRRLEECEKAAEVEYGITTTCVYEGTYKLLTSHISRIATTAAMKTPERMFALCR